ncbi:PAS domain-containing sensor histidine kinase [Oceanispirochaeta crateris]|uniref:histidine kinase n=1 Tax=Oceanispirochaeta crateris TaxID=2518645 RepID=A0A5C1QLY9_9SPIO|nr:PAS domain-containing sensor histidine kinase [Oceanispirochaeta crateris]QEN08229.1 PAS domain-containing sensor histidine kinase [Oceanispirochaeta crateris]
MKDQNRKLNALMLINRLLVEETDPAIFLDSVCHILVRENIYSTVWIVLTQHNLPVEPYFHAGFAAGGDSSFEPMKYTLKMGILPSCVHKSLDSGDSVLIHDSLAECSHCPLNHHLENQSDITRPLGFGSASLGWMTASGDPLVVEDDEEKDFFSGIADLVHYGLKNIYDKLTHHDLDSQYEAFLESSSDIVLELDLKGRLLKANHSAFDLFGPLLKERFGRTLEPMMNKDNFRLVEETLNHVLENPVPVSTVAEGMDWTGHFVSVSINIYPHLNTKGEVIGFSVFLKNNPDAEVKKKEPRENDERAYNLFDNAPVAYQSLDEEGNFLEVNENWLRITGYERHEVIGRWFGDFLAPGYKEGFQKRFPLFKKRGTIHSEFFLVGKKGELHYISFDGRIGYNQDGSFRQTYCVLRDETEKKKIEDATKEKEIYFRNIFEYINSGISIFEPYLDGEDFIFLDLNPFGQKISNVKLEDIKGRRVSEVFPGVSSMGLLKCLQLTHKTGESQFLPVREYKDDRLTQIVENHISKLPSGNLLVIFDDKSKQFQMETRLRQTEKMEAIGHLAGGIAHDFNNILSGILGYAELVSLKNAQDEEIHSYMDNIISAGDRAKKLVHQILSFSRQKPEKNEIFYIIPVIQDALRLLRASIPSSIHIKTAFSDETNPVLGDSTSIHEILMNLCTNASYAMDEKGVLEISFFEENLEKELDGILGKITPGEYSILSVKDNGSGMDADTLSHIFEPFFTTKKVGDGTGMGLSVVFGIVGNHKGNITVHSIPDEGTEFSVYIPQVIRNLDSVPQQDTPVFKGSNEHVLVIDDEELNCDLFRDLLINKGYKVTTFCESQDVLDYLEQNADIVDIIVSDQTMPRMTGSELSVIIKDLYPQIPVILCSGYSTVVTPFNYKEFGAAAYLAKPVRIENLVYTIHQVLTS